MWSCHSGDRQSCCLLPGPRAHGATAHGACDLTVMTARYAIAEAIIFLGLAGGVAVTVNARRSGGLELGRNYFPAGASANQHAGTPFRIISLEEASLYARAADPSIVFIDARDDDRFGECHIPGAIQFDYFRPELYIDRVRSATAQAELVIVYCGGSGCQDGLYAAEYLTVKVDPPLDPNKVCLFEGGMYEWCGADLCQENDDGGAEVCRGEGDSNP